MSIIVLEAPEHRYDFTGLAAVKAEMQKRIDDHDDDELLESLIAQMGASISAWCGRRFLPETIREDLHIDSPASTLTLSRWPIISLIAVVTEAGALAADQYEVDAEAGLLYRLTGNRRRINWAPGRVSVDYVTGFEALPGGIERATILMVRNAFTSRGRDPTLRTDDVSGIGSSTFGLGTSFPPEVEELLLPYRATHIG